MQEYIRRLGLSPPDLTAGSDADAEAGGVSSDEQSNGAGSSPENSNPFHLVSGFSYSFKCLLKMLDDLLDRPIAAPFQTRHWSSVRYVRLFFPPPKHLSWQIRA
jgi:hypothetical protein